MHYLTAIVIFVLAVVLGFGIGSYRSAAVAEFMSVSAACEIVKIAQAKGYSTNRDKLIEAIAASPNADGELKAALASVRRSKQC